MCVKPREIQITLSPGWPLFLVKKKMRADNTVFFLLFLSELSTLTVRVHRVLQTAFPDRVTFRFHEQKYLFLDKSHCSQSQLVLTIRSLPSARQFILGKGFSRVGNGAAPNESMP
ncbi:hypothetical protein AVEN_36238-1 [Araneus ventricosus]|uniref:Uncharacterized protein n=1 Tax=Araneus ventricosus TaxID=182803 RepID=A0A4Y2J8S3_ARAVE|nr:hypothetical protein AVEN_36238-1 [Araneus ventricosus]